MRRTAVALVLLVAAFGLVATGCGQEQEQSATPETVEGSTPTETTETETTETETTETTGTETTETDETETTETTETETTATTPAVEGDPVAGKEVFLGASACGGCHTLADAGTSGASGPNLDEAQPDAATVKAYVRGGGGGMPAFGDDLSNAEIDAVAAYVASVAGG